MEAGAWPTMVDRLVSVLSDLIASSCRETVERRLAAMPSIARAALLPSEAARAELATRIYGQLSQAGVAGLLSPAIETEHCLLLQGAGSADPMLREASLDTLGGHPDTRTAVALVREACGAFLAPALSLLGAATETASAPAPTASVPSAASHTANEAAFLQAMRQPAFDTVIGILAAQTGVTSNKVAEAVWTRDARSLLGLAWRAGYSMRAARIMQVQLAGIPPDAVIGAEPGGVAPIGRGEVAWQLALLTAS